jgi:c-di-GMP-binding flagellar brake protein YcgR
MMNTQSTADGGRFNADVRGSRLLWSRHQILELLNRFIREDYPVSLHYADESKMIVTRALRLNMRLDRVYFEYGDHKTANSDLLRSQEVQFSVENGSGQSQFSSPRVRDVLLDGKPVFHIPIPERVVEADRRAHHRIKIPQISAPVVTFSLPDGRKAKGRLADMSAGGIGVIGLATDLKVRSETEIRNCLIELNDGERLLVDLKIRHARASVDTEGKVTHRVGFSLASRPKEFSDLLKAFTVDL